MSEPSVSITYDAYHFRFVRNGVPIYHKVVRLYPETTRVLSGPWRIDVIDLFSEMDPYPGYVISTFPLTDEEGPIIGKLFVEACKKEGVTC
jgi:hypothetical protein